MSNAQGLDVEAVIQFKVVIYTNFIAAVVAAYDILLTSHDEIDLVWRRAWRWCNLLFLVNRYLAPIQCSLSIVSWLDPNLPAITISNVNLFAGVWVAPLVGTIIEVLQILRVWVLYHNSRLVHALLSILLVIYVAGTVGMAIVISQNLTTIPSPFPSVLGSDIVGSDTVGPQIAFELLPAIFSIGLFVETVLVVLIILKTYSHVKASPAGTPILGLILRDGCLYFIVIFFLMIANVICYTLPDSVYGYTSLFIEPELCLSSVLCSRIFLNLRRQMYQPQGMLSTVPDGETRDELELHVIVR